MDACFQANPSLHEHVRIIEVKLKEVNDSLWKHRECLKGAFEKGNFREQLAIFRPEL